MVRNIGWCALFAFSYLIFLSNQNGVPQAVTMAPGESGFGCNACHNQPGNYVTSIGLDIMTLDSQLVSSYIPNGDYIARIKVSGTNSPKSFGFQMVSLSDADNKDMGKWSSLGARVKQITMLNRKYLEQSSPKDDGIFYANWKAPSTDIGSVSFYFSGLAVNRDGNTNGDTNKSASFKLFSPTTSSTEDDIKKGFDIFPNPTSNFIYISSKENVTVHIHNANGSLIKSFRSSENAYSIEDLNSGLFFVVLKDEKGQPKHIEKLIKI